MGQKGQNASKWKTTTNYFSPHYFSAISLDKMTSTKQRFLGLFQNKLYMKNIGSKSINMSYKTVYLAMFSTIISYVFCVLIRWNLGISLRNKLNMKNIGSKSINMNGKMLYLAMLSTIIDQILCFWVVRWKWVIIFQSLIPSGTWDFFDFWRPPSLILNYSQVKLFQLESFPNLTKFCFKFLMT